MTVIKNGTVAIADGSAEVVGTGTSWASGSQPARTGDTFMVPGAGFVSTIASVTSDTDLTLETTRSGAISAAGFEIRLDSPSRLSGLEALAAFSAMAARYQLLVGNIRMLDVLSVGANSPPTSPPPASGDRHVVGGSPTGAWAGYAYHYAIKIDGGWRFETPSRADGAADRATNDWWFYTGSGWAQRALDEGALRYDVIQALAAGQKTQGLTNLGISHSAAVAGTTQLATLTQLNALLPAAVDGQVLQRVGGAWASRTVDQMLAGMPYSEGTWTPVLSSTGAEPTNTYSEQSGRFIRFGRFVGISGYCSGTRSGGSGTARIGGLPYSPLISSPLSVRSVGVTASGTVAALASPNGTAPLLSYNSTGSPVDLPITSVGTGGFGFHMQGVYFV